MGYPKKALNEPKDSKRTSGSLELSLSNQRAKGKLNPRSEKRSMADQAYEQIEEAIVTLKLAPGMSISELELSELTGIGRTPIREAIQRLSRDGLITVLPKRGLLIAPLDLMKQMKLLEARREFEGLICRAAAMRATASEKQQFARLTKEFLSAAKSKDSIAFARADKEFNELCLVAARNEYAEGAMRLLLGLSRRFWYFHQGDSKDWAEMALLHANLAHAISKGEVAKAQDAVDELIKNVEKFATATLTNSI